MAPRTDDPTRTSGWSRVARTTATARRPSGPTPARSLLLRAAEIGGHPAVVYVDAPPGAAATLLDPARVTLPE